MDKSKHNKLLHEYKYLDYPDLVRENENRVLLPFSKITKPFRTLFYVIGFFNFIIAIMILLSVFTELFADPSKLANNSLYFGMMAILIFSYRAMFILEKRIGKLINNQNDLYQSLFRRKEKERQKILEEFKTLLEQHGKT